MTRQYTLFAIILGFAAFSSAPALADDIGFGKPNANNVTSSATTSDTTSDAETVDVTWYEALFGVGPEGSE